MQNITDALVREHKLILRMLSLLEKRAGLTAAGQYGNYRFFLDAVDFIRSYADRFHHAKEEDVLFEALVENGMPKENSPVAAMLMEHDEGRRYVRAMEEAAREALEGKPGRNLIIAASANNYLLLLREHISKEDNILYPLAERLIPEAMRSGIRAGYEAAEAKTAAGFEKSYEKIVEKYEAETLGQAA